MSTTHHHHHYPPPRPSIQEKLNSAKGKRDIELHDYERQVQLQRVQTQQFANQIASDRKQMMDTLGEIQRMYREERGRVESQVAELEKKITDQISSVDEEIAELTNNTLQTEIAIKEAEGSVKLYDGMCSRYLDQKKKQEDRLQVKLQTEIENLEALETNTSDTLEGLLGQRGIADAAIQLISGLAVDLVEIPKHNQNVKKMFSALHAALDILLTKVDNDLKLVSSKLHATPLMLAMENEQMNPLLQEFVNENTLHYDDLKDLVSGKLELEEYKNLGPLQKRQATRYVESAVVLSTPMAYAKKDFELLCYATADIANWNTGVKAQALEAEKHVQEAKLLFGAQ